MSLEYVYNTSILDFEVQVIVHQCYANAKRKTAKGLAKDIFDKYNYANVYQHRIEHSKPGTIELRGFKKDQRWICALYGQYNPGKPAETDYDTSTDRIKWFKMCLKTIPSKLKNLKSLAFPYKIGCGLAKGAWSVYEKIIIDFAKANSNIKVYIVSIEPPPPRKVDYSLNFLEGLVATIKKKKKEGLYKEDFESLHKQYLYSIAHPEEIDNTFKKDLYSWKTSNLEDYTEKNVPVGWEDFFNKELDVNKGSIHEISKYLTTETVRSDVFPELHMVYTAFDSLKPSDIKVILCGQDPYHDVGQAMGLSFSVMEGINPPPSLKNIYKELVKEKFTVKDDKSGSLLKWRDQGVLMINTALTVRAHEAKSHSKKWNESFTPNLMKWLNDNCDDVVLLLWGGPAQKMAKYFGDRHKKVMCAHPSPLSAHRGFFDSDCFIKVNKELKKIGRQPINWSL